MSSLRGRQIRLTVILLIIILGCIAGGIFLHIRREKMAVSAQANQVSEAQMRYNAQAGNTDASVVTNLLGTSKGQGNVVFCSVGNSAQVVEVASAALASAGLTPVFFAEDGKASTEAMQAVVDAGYELGLFFDNLADETEAETVSALSSGGETVMQVSLRRVNSMLVPWTPASTLPAAAMANDIETIYVVSETVQPQAITSQESAQSTVSGIRAGKIYLFELSGATEENVRTAATWLGSAMGDSQSAAVSQQTQIEADVAAEPVSRVYTTEQAVAFTFSGLGDSEELTGVLNALQSVQGTATFFVTRDELTTCADDIQRILDAGHTLGISVAQGGTDAAVILAELNETSEAIRSGFGYTGTLPVRQSYGSPSSALCQAAGNGGYTLLSQMLNAVDTSVARYTDAQQVLDSVMPQDGSYLQRGEIVHFQMKLFQYSKSVLGELVQKMATQRNLYAIRPATDILSNTAYTYTYPVPEQDYLPEVSNKIYPGQLEGKDAFQEVLRRYIGISWVNSRFFLPGFYSHEIQQMDTSGLVKNDANMVFLTFDDWGTDANITRLLEVLKKHNAKATFFVRTEYVENNPNLLRAIAEDGHTIGSHTRTHFQLSNALNESGTKFAELSDEELEAFKQDIAQSYQDLLDVIGDVSVDGKASLSQLFRPPTLAVGRNSLEAVLDYGFTYSVSGTYTAQDYKAESAESIANSLSRRTKSGAVFILHMSDNSIHTAEAIDLYLTEMEAGDEPYQFVGLSEVLK